MMESIGKDICLTFKRFLFKHFSLLLKTPFTVSPRGERLRAVPPSPVGESRNFGKDEGKREIGYLSSPDCLNSFLIIKPEI